MYKENYVVDSSGKRIAVMLPIKEYERMLLELEEKEDIRLYDQVKSRDEERIPLEQYLEERKKKRKNG
ncbi:MAG: hypothetical protein KJ607_08280 [Bacteroidetes bacterium]|nr:hypothetical protein [Bacteroidota bacterium]